VPAGQFSAERARADPVRRWQRLRQKHCALRELYLLRVHRGLFSSALNGRSPPPKLGAGLRCSVNPGFPSRGCGSGYTHRYFLPRPQMCGLRLLSEHGMAVTTARVGDSHHRASYPYGSFPDAAEPDGDTGPGRDGEGPRPGAGNWPQDRHVIRLIIPFAGRGRRSLKLGLCHRPRRAAGCW
jgi:hypothetical protein